MVHTIVAHTAWHPGEVFPVAGFTYLRYGPIVKWVWLQIAGKTGVSTDTSRNTEYTYWDALDHFVDEWAREVARAETGRT